MSRELRRQIESTPTGALVRQRLDDQVVLITSLPTEAAERVRVLANEALLTGTRASALSAKIMETGEVAKSRANLIARTETSRTATELTRARAKYVGSTHFVWRTSNDSSVRPSHRRLDGMMFEWSNPPVCDAPDIRALPGSTFNCRCFPEVVLPDDV
jgi:SPP1 gp7 family putative phage head morphogenesis protein